MTPIRLSLMISLLFHFLALAFLQVLLPVPWTGEQRRMYKVELIRPPVSEIGPEDLSGLELSDIHHQDSPKPPNPGEDTISLDTRDERYASYAGAIKNRIMQYWKYPDEAKKNLSEGSLLLIFTLDRRGHLIEARIRKSSGFSILDEEASRAIESGSPFPPFPANITADRLHIRAGFIYRLTVKK